MGHADHLLSGGPGGCAHAPRTEAVAQGDGLGQHVVVERRHVVLCTTSSASQPFEAGVAQRGERASMLIVPSPFLGLQSAGPGLAQGARARHAAPHKHVDSPPWRQPRQVKWA